MTTGARAAAQLSTIAWLHRVLAERGIDYWLFGGWAVDFHAGRVTRAHEDIDIAVWLAELSLVEALLGEHDWTHTPEPGEQGYTAYERDGVRIEMAFLVADPDGVVYTPLVDGQGEWPDGSFGPAVAEVEGVAARVMDREALIADKSGPRDDPAVAAKDRADIALLRSRPPGD